MQEWLPDTLEELRLDVTGTFLEELDEQNQEVEFRELMTNSVWYVLLNRCGLDAQEYLDAEDFRHITDFNQLIVLGHLGSAVNEISRPVLMQIGRYVLNNRANKGRSFLTMLGIIIGIASVIAIVSIGEGTKNQMNSEIDGIGGGQIYISISNDAMTEGEWITPDDVQEVRQLDAVEGISVSNSYDGETVTGKGTFTISLTGEGPDAKMVNNSEMKYGNYFGEQEIEEGKNVCVISDSDAKRLFGTDDVVGMSLDVTCYDSSKSFRIMGVTTQKENGTFAVAEGAISKEDAALSKKEYKKKLAKSKYPSVSYEVADRISERLGLEVRVAVPGHTQRGGSPCPYDRVLCTRLGSAAAKAIMDEDYGCMIAMVNGQTKRVPLADVAGKLKTVDPKSQMIKEAKRTGICFGD